MQKKYEFTGETEILSSSESGDTILKRIRSLIDIPSLGVRVGDIGGLIENEQNLSQRGTCWVAKGGVVIENAKIIDHAFIDDSVISGTCKIGNHAKVMRSTLMGEVEVYGDTSVTDSFLSGSTALSGKSILSNSNFHNVQIMFDATIDADSSTLNAQDSFRVMHNVTMNHCDINVLSGSVSQTTVMSEVTTTDDCILELNGKSILKRLSLSNATLQTLHYNGKTLPVHIEGKDEVVVQNGKFLLSDVTITDNVVLNGRKQTEQAIVIRKSTLKGDASIERVASGSEYLLTDTHLDVLSKVQLKSKTIQNTIRGLRLTNDELFLF